MQILGNLFNIIIFVCFIGSIFTVLMLFLQKVLHFTLPLWVGIAGAAFFLIPVVIPQVELLSPVINDWMRGYEIASILWILGVVAFTTYFILRGVFAHHAIQFYPICTDKRVNQIYAECTKILEMKKQPALLFGTLKEPACVVTFLRPTIILRKDIARQLSDQELRVVLCHELTHIKRKHHLSQRIYEIVTALYWFNPLVWIAKSEFSYICELDCDNNTIDSIGGQTNTQGYTTAMLHLMELSSAAGNPAFGKIGALAFLLAKQRFTNILHKQSKKRFAVMIIAVAVCATLTISLALTTSGAMFYPYPAYSYGQSGEIAK